MNQSWTEVIEENPIAEGLATCRSAFLSATEPAGIYDPSSIFRLEPDELRRALLSLVLTLHFLPAARHLRTANGRCIRDELVRCLSAATTADAELEVDLFRPLIEAVVNKADDLTIWNQVNSAVSEVTPPPHPGLPSIQQTPVVRNTSSFANSSEHRKHVDGILKEELGQLYAGIPRFLDVYFGGVDGLETAAEVFLEQCKAGATPSFDDENGWTAWPTDAKENDVVEWLAGIFERLASFAPDRRSGSLSRPRRLLAEPNMPIKGSVAQRNLDVGVVSELEHEPQTATRRYHWHDILVPGELKSKASADKPGEAWLDLGRYAREALAAQDTRRFVLGFTICGALMRVWVFDRLGGVASEQIDINKDGRKFVYVMLGFLWMSEEDLGFDPTIQVSGHQRYVEIERRGIKERVIIDRLFWRARCVAGRATTCWRAHSEAQPQTLLVIKDSWQYPERAEEGEMLSEVTAKQVVNVARHYHHETVRVRGINDDICASVRRGLDISTASSYPLARPKQSSTMMSEKSPADTRISPSRKRSLSQTGPALSPSKRLHLALSDEIAATSLNRVHRRVIVRDYGKPIYEASSVRELLASLEGCIEGHESLHRAGFLHRDISTHNLLIKDAEDSSCWSSFLIDLDLAIREDRETASGPKGKTGTWVFISTGVLLGERHAFMHDLESFFWVLFWICVHYDGPGKKWDLHNSNPGTT